MDGSSLRYGNNMKSFVAMNIVVIEICFLFAIWSHETIS